VGLREARGEASLESIQALLLPRGCKVVDLYSEPGMGLVAALVRTATSQVARYSGQGSIDDAANFSCVAP